MSSDINAAKDRTLTLLQLIKKAQDSYSTDKEDDHIKADEALCDLLRAHGHDDVVEAFKAIYKYHG